MTNYSERLDEILLSHGAEQGELHYSLKQAITSLIKELVAEAKPESQSWDGLEPVEQIALSARRKAIDEFEQTLLKALEEV